MLFFKRFIFYFRHWVEKNAEPWSRNELKELLLGQIVEQGAAKITFKDFKKLEGDATGNLLALFLVLDVDFCRFFCTQQQWSNCL